VRTCIECDEPAERTLLRCTRHLAINGRNAMKRYERLKAAGMCIRCGAVPCAPAVRCGPCAARAHAATTARTAAKKAAGVCHAACENAVWREGATYCADHHGAYNPFRRKYGPVKGDRCEACGATEKLVHDHDHVTGEFRGTLCGLCNTALGMVKDDPDRLRALIGYLERAA